MKGKSKIILLSLVLVISTAFMFGCTGKDDGAYAVKLGDEVLPVGAYMYFVTQSFNLAQSKLQGDETINTAKIDGVTAKDWIVQNATNSAKTLLVIEKEFKKLSLALTVESTEEVKGRVESYLDNQKEYFENLGISSADLTRALELIEKRDMLFKEKYKDVPDKDILDWYNGNYLCLSTFQKPTPGSADAEEGGTSPGPEDAAEKIEERFKKYVSLANEQKKGLPEISEAIKNGEKTGVNPLIKEPIAKEVLEFEIGKDELQKIIALGVNQATHVKSLGGSYVFVYKNAVEEMPPDLSAPDTKENLALEMKQKEFVDWLMAEVKGAKFSISEKNTKNIDLSKLFTELA